MTANQSGHSGFAYASERPRGRSNPNSRELDWTGLMTHAREGDSEAYITLIRLITPYLRALASKSLRDPEDIDDTVQDILLTLHLVQQSYDPERPFGPWLVALASRRVFDRLRRKGRERLYEEPLTNKHESAAFDEKKQDRADLEKLKDAIADLPPTQQQAIRLLKLREMSLKEAAFASGTSVASLKMAALRGLQNLRIALGEGAADNEDISKIAVRKNFTFITEEVDRAFARCEARFEAGSWIRESQPA